MAWIDYKHWKTNLRKTKYNNSVCTSYVNINNMVDNFDGLFDNLTNFTSEISSIHLYPFPLAIVDGTEGNKLSTSRGTTSVVASKLSVDNTYLTLGEKPITEHFHNFADYKGYTHIKVFLPFVGFVDVDTNECMNKYLQFRLIVDYFSGKGVYIIGVSDNTIISSNAPYAKTEEDESIRILSTFECNIGIEIPLGSSNVSDIKRNLLLGAVKVAGSTMMASASVKHSMSPNISSHTTTETYEMYGRGTEKGSRFKKLESGTSTQRTTSVHNRPVNVLRPISEAFDGSIDVLNKSYPNGNSDRINDAGVMWDLSTEIKVLIYRPKMIGVGHEYKFLFGMPLGEVKYLHTLNGYTEISNIRFEGIGFETATQKEIAMLEEVVANGIIL